MSSSVHADPPPPIVVDPEGLQYEVGPQLGKGGFAICHSAQVRRHNAVVALKIVRSTMDSPKLLQKFTSEIQLHSKISHPSIVEMYRAFSFGSSTYVVLEICPNGSLADAIKKRKYFTMPEIRRFMIQTCGAVKYLHQRGIVHRDLKTGNLFLDRDMNVKCGDFGLAALVLSPGDYGAIRRTTMCGTPNYLAPEVLEKTGKGHDEKVDLWAIGIMMYTLAVGRAPFHAAKREDIYRKLKAREYSWPDLAKFPNEITDELRDIVSLLLVHEDERPTPDEIVNHPFFRLGYIPLTLDASCTSKVPKWPRICPPSASTIRRGYTDEWYTLCKESSVGEYEPGKRFGAYGSRRNKSVARDCQKEIEAGKQPIVPFAKDTIYLPFPQRTPWPHQSGGGLSEISEEKETSSEGQALVETTANDRSKGRLPRTRKREQVLSDAKENDDPLQESEPLTRPLSKQPTRMRAARKTSNNRIAAATATTANSVAVRAPPKEIQQAQLVKPSAEIVKESNLEESRRVRPSKPAPLASEKTESLPHERAASSLRSIGPELPYTDPTSVLEQLRVFRTNIARALDKKPPRSKHEKPPRLPFVSKWVDYSRKYGVGFALEDGTIGCLIGGNSKHPVTSTIVRDGQRHLLRTKNEPTYLSKVPVEHFAAPHPTDSISPVEILDKQRRDHSRLIWHKFARYMCVQLDDTKPERPSSQTTFVKFYQRLGNVGFWVFNDGAFQVNFPDHTKIVLSADAVYSNFICLSLEALAWFEETGDLPWKHIKDRATLQGSVQQLLYGSADRRDPIKEMTEGNDLRLKLEFIMSVVDGWIEGGGLGCLSEPRSYIWQGKQLEDNKKLDWASMGRLGGDVI